MFKKYIIFISSIFVPILLILLLVNIKVDSGFVVNNRSNEISNILLSGKNAAVIVIPSQWGSLQKALVKNKLQSDNKTPSEIVVFGNSRSSEIHSGLFPNNTFFNCALPGGNVLDMIAIYGLYKKSNLLPKYVLISIDPWSFYARKKSTINNDIHYFADTTLPLTVNLDLINEYNNGLNYLNINEPKLTEKKDSKWNLKTFKEILNPTYFQLNIKYLIKKTVLATDQLKKKSYFVIRSDGGYSLAFPNQIDSIALKEKSNQFVEIHKSNYFITIDNHCIYWTYFKKLLTQLQKDGVTPIIYISPLNPIVYDNLAQVDEIDLESKIRQFCEEKSIIVLGSFNPHRYGYHTIGHNFIDYYHPTKSVVETIFKFHQIELDSIGIQIKD
ncbi:MAG: hypothetical protein H6Q25_671 [Bacteroidetes bacterium]|nr:hypothetical protein [Bacteroidota bacterium]